MGGEQHAQMTTLGSRPSDKYDEQNKQAQQEIHDALILDLQDKERAIQQGKNVQCTCRLCIKQIGFFNDKDTVTNVFDSLSADYVDLISLVCIFYS